MEITRQGRQATNENEKATNFEKPQKRQSLQTARLQFNNCQDNEFSVR